MPHLADCLRCPGFLHNVGSCRPGFLHHVVLVFGSGNKEVLYREVEEAKGRIHTFGVWLRADARRRPRAVNDSHDNLVAIREP